MPKKKKEFSSIERTFMIIKPDGVKRGLVGKIYTRLENIGLKLVASRMIQATDAIASAHYPGENKDWLINLAEKTFKNYGGDSKAVKADWGTDDKLEVGTMIYKALAKTLTTGPVILMVWEGNHAVAVVRKIAGATIPDVALPGTIRGDYGFDSPYLAAKSGRFAISNIVHISESVSEAEREIKHWFGGKYKYLGDYDRLDYTSSFEAFA